MSILSKLSQLPKRLPQLVLYLYYHKLVFGITNTKFDISFTVFRESFLGDQYRIKSFASNLKDKESLLFLDIGRNHGFVFYYFLHHLARQGIKIDKIQYIGIDPSPLKFAYYNKSLQGTKVDYRLIDKAVVFDETRTVRLKYGERNLGNFNVAGSNYEKSMAKVARQRDFIEIEVDALRIDDLLELVRQTSAYDSAIVKIDCKNRTEVILERSLEILADHSGPWLAACERDHSAGGRLEGRAEKLGGTLVSANMPY